MQMLKFAVVLLKQGAWLTVVDLKDAYYSVPVVKKHRQYLRKGYLSVEYKNIVFASFNASRIGK